MLRDRGSKKWTSLMLPEHVEALKNWDHERNLDKPPAERMEWEWADIQQKVEVAYHQKLPISFTVFRDHKWFVITGWIRQIYWHKAALLLECDDGKQNINFHTIQGAEMDD